MPKKIKNIYDESLTYKNLYESYLSCKRGKAFRSDVIKYSLKYEFYLSNALNGLKNMTYTFSKYREFYVLEPKKRRILSATFADRIVHTWFVKYILECIFTKQFVNTTYACIKDRGMHKAVFDVQRAMRIYKREYGNYYVLKFDVSKYFDSINKEILFNIIQRKVSDKKVLWLVREILNSSNDCYTKKNIGIPIGNYTSQIFANIYLNELDQYISKVIKCKKYFRYMDDGILLFRTKNEAKYALKRIETFLKEQLNLSLNKKTNIFKNTQGINFCGYYITEKFLKLRFKGKQKLKKKLKLVNKLIFSRKITIEEAKKMLNGHRGYICHANIQNLINKLFIINN